MDNRSDMLERLRQLDKIIAESHRLDEILKAADEREGIIATLEHQEEQARP